MLLIRKTFGLSSCEKSLLACVYPPPTRFLQKCVAEVVSHLDPDTDIVIKLDSRGRPKQQCQ